MSMSKDNKNIVGEWNNSYIVPDTKISVGEWNESTIEVEEVDRIDKVKYQIEYLREKGYNIESWNDSITDPIEIEKEIKKRQQDYLEQKKSLN